jgi:general secretion pathway protein G
MTSRITSNRTNAPRSLRGASRRGFSLLELMLVLVILGLLSTVAAVALLPQAEKAKIRTTKTSMNVIKQQITAYQLEKNRVPDALSVLVPDFLEEGGLRDGWSRDFYYSPTSNGARAFSLVSAGPDGQFETEDDIDVWTMDIETGG